MPSASRLTAALAVALALPVAAASAQQPGEGSRFMPALEGGGGAVASISREASTAAVRVLDRGGNAVDAAVTAVFTLGVARPELCGIGGGGTMVLRTASGGAATLDFREQSPVDFSPTGSAPNRVGVPGLVAGMATALARYGTIPLARAIAPAEALARQGIELTPQQAAYYAQNAARLGAVEETRRVYLDDGGGPFEAGDDLVLADYADTLERIAKDGPDGFYEGPVAAAILEALEDTDGTLGADDLQGYRAFWRGTLETRYRGSRILTVPAPAAGGQVLVEALNLLGEIDPYPASPLSAARFHLLAEAQKLAWADQDAYVGDPRFSQVPTRRLLGEAYSDDRRPEVTGGRARTYAPAKPADPSAASAAPAAGADARSTAVTVIDAQGTAVAVTCSLEQAFGSAIVPKGTGFLLNSALGAFDPPEAGRGPNAPAGAKRPRSFAAPALVVDDGRPVLALSAGGGASMVAGVLNVLVGVLDFDQDLAHAIDAPRADPRGECAGGGLQLCIEDARVGRAVLDDLAARGHALSVRGEYALAPEVQAVAGTAEGRQATSDPRAETGPAVQEDALPGLRVAVAPRRPEAGRRVVRVRVRGPGGAAVQGAVVRFAGVTKRTGRSGVVRVSRRLRAGTEKAVATHAGYASVAVQVTVRR